MAEYDGYLAEILDENQLKLVLVVQKTGSKLQVVEQFGKQRSIKAGHLVVGFEQGANRSGLSQTIKDFEERLDQLASGVETELVWAELSVYEKDLAPDELAKLWFGKTSPEHTSAIFRALLRDSLRFKRNGVSFQARAPEQVASLETARLREEEKRQREGLITRWLDELERDQGLEQERVLGSAKAATPLETYLDDETRREFEKDLLAYLVERKSGDLARVFSARHSENPYEAAYELLDRLDLIPPGSNPISLIAGINPEFSRRALEAAQTLSPSPLEGERRHDLSQLVSFSIDDENTREIDDALSLEVLPDRLRLGVHIADLSSLIEFQSPLDLEAQARTLTLYLPEETHTMFPERVGCELASLNRDRERPALSLLAEFSLEDLRPLGHEFVLSRVVNRYPLTYHEVDRILAEGSDPEGGSVPAGGHPLSESLALADRLAESLKAARHAQKAFSFNRPELRVRVRENQIELEVNRGESRAQRLVQEAMILYNSLAGEKAARESLPVIYRIQPKPDGEFPLGEEIEYRPELARELFKQIRPAKLSLETGRHAGLGAESYIQVSSPIRRYADLVMQRQLASSVAGRVPVYEQGELYRILVAAEETGREVVALERRSIRFWAIEYLARAEPDETYSCVVTQLMGKQALVELDAFPIRGLLDGGPAGLKPGAKLEVRLRTCDARRDILRFQPA